MISQSSESNNNSPRLRRYASKRRGGCKTCSARHIRCDQGRPVCAACQRSSRPCSYSPEASDNTDKPLKLVMFEPNKKAIPRVSRRASPETPDARAFSYFLEVVGPKLGGCFETESWDRIVCQVGQDFPPLRQAITALSALWESSFASSSSNTQKSHDTRMVALRTYTSALSEARKASTDSSSIKELLICNLLFVCIENLQQHHNSALSQISSGLFLFSFWQASKQQDQGTNQDQLSELLMKAYQRLLTQTLSFFDLRSLNRGIFVPALLPEVAAVPDQFPSLESCRDTFYTIVSGMMHQSFTAHLQDIEIGDHTLACIRPVSDFREDVLDQFGTAFLDLRDRYHGDNGRDRAALAILEMLYLTIRIYHAAGLEDSEMAFDRFEPTYQQIVDLGDGILRCRSSDDTFCMDMEALPALYVVGSSCRDPALRRRAIALLRSVGGQEGVYNGEMLARFSEEMMSIEEAGLPHITCCGDVPESARLTTHTVAIDCTSREAHVTFYQGHRLPSLPGKLVQRVFLY